MKTIIFLIFFISLFFCACQNTLTTESAIIRGSLTEIQVKSPYDNVLQIDSIFSSIYPIKLETNKHCLIGNFRKVLFYNNHIYISNGTNNLFVFSDNGMFFREISKKGRGPGEFLELRDFQIDSDGNVYIFDYQKILVFSADGHHIESVNFKTPHESVFFNPIEFCLSEKKGEYYLWGGSFGIKSNVNNNHFALYRIDKSGSFTERYFPVKHSIMGNSNRFRFFEDIINIAPVFGNDTVYSIVNGQLKTRYYLNFGDRSLKEDIPENFASLGEFKSQVNKHSVVDVYNFIETSSWCYFNYNFNQLVYNAYYSKSTNKTYVSNVYPRVPNRVTPFRIDANYGDNMVAVMNSDYIVREIERLMSNRSELSGDEEDLILTLLDVKETDNPVLLICELRNDM